MKVINKQHTLKDVLKSFKKYRKRYIPKKFNQLDILEYILSDKIDYGVDITTRSNGKTTNYIGMLTKLSIDFNFKVGYITDHFNQWDSVFANIKYTLKIFDIKIEDDNDFWYFPLKGLIKFGYKDKELGYIINISRPQDIKRYYSQVSECKILVYDEFIRADEDYYSNEDVLLNQIKQTCDKDCMNDNIKNIFGNKSRVILLANPINLLSPVLHSMGIIKILEEKEINEEVIIEGRIGLRLNSNAETNKEYIDNEFMPQLNKQEIESMFNINKYNVISSDYLAKIYNNKDTLSTKIYIDSTKSLIVTCLNNNYILSLSNDVNNCSFCTNIEDKDNNRIYLDSNWIDDEYMSYLFEHDMFKFSDMYTKNEILSSNLYQINYIRVIGYLMNNIKREEQVKINSDSKHKYILERLYHEIF